MWKNLEHHTHPLSTHLLTLKIVILSYFRRFCAIWHKKKHEILFNYFFLFFLLWIRAYNFFYMLNTFFGIYFHQNYIFLTSNEVGKVYISDYCFQKFKRAEKIFKINFFCAHQAQKMFCFTISFFMYRSV